MTYQGGASFDCVDIGGTTPEGASLGGGAAYSTLVTINGHARSLVLTSTADYFTGWAYNPGGARIDGNSFWFTVDGLPGVATAFGFDSTRSAFIYLNPDGTIKYDSTTGTAKIVPGVWYWFQQHWNGSAWNYYIDGTLDASGIAGGGGSGLKYLYGLGGIPMYYSDFVAWLDGAPGLNGLQSISPIAKLATVKGYGTYIEANWQPTVIPNARNAISGSGAGVTYDATHMWDTGKYGVYATNQLVNRFIENVGNANNGRITANADVGSPNRLQVTVTWAPATPANGDQYQIAQEWEQLNENPPDGSGTTDVTIMWGGTVGARHTMKLQSDSDLSIPASSTIDGTTLITWGHGQGSKTNNFNFMLRIGGVDYTSSSYTWSSTSYAWAWDRQYYSGPTAITLANLATWEAGFKAATGNTGLMSKSVCYVAFCYTPPSQPSKPAARDTRHPVNLFLRQGVKRAAVY